MKRHEVITKYQWFLKQFMLTPEEAVLSAEGAMMVHGLRDTTDVIYLVVKPAFFSSLLASGEFVTYEYLGSLGLKFGKSFDIHSMSGREIEVIDGIGVYSLKAILEQKLRMNREQDKDDIRTLHLTIGLKGLQSLKDQAIRSSYAASKRKDNDA